MSQDFKLISLQRCSIKKVFLKISQNSHENTFVEVYFLIKLQAPTKVFSREFKEIFNKNLIKIEQNS